MRRQCYIAVSLLFILSFLSLNIASSQSQSTQSGQSRQSGQSSQSGKSGQSGQSCQPGQSGMTSGMINSDPNYRALRDAKLDKTYTVSNLTLKRDVATIKLTSGRISFITPVLNRITIGVFVG